MITQNYNIPFKQPILLNNYCDIEKILFFDIETTGFTPKTSFVYLISAGYFIGDNFKIIQFFSENSDEELKILTAFDNILSNFILLAHFNGDKFDIPYLKGRYEYHNINSHISGLESMDIYVELKKFKKLFRIDNCKLKTFEKFLNIERNDMIDGGEAINEYLRYTRTQDKSALDACLLHNYEDVLNLPLISKLIIFNQLYDITGFRYTYSSDDNYFCISTELNSIPELNLSCENEYIKFCIKDDIASMSFKIIENKIVNHFSNYKKYVFLNSENYAVDSEYARLLNLKNCKKCTVNTAYNFIETDTLNKLNHDDIKMLWNENYSWLLQVI